VIASAQTIEDTEFERMRDRNELTPNKAYRVVHYGWHGGIVSGHFAWSPDGVGCFFYDTYNELMENHG
jgi:hypothetical protein